MPEALVTGILALIAAISGHLLERRYGHRIDEHERRIEALEGTEHDPDA